MKPITITEATFNQDVLQSDTLTVVDFWALWCGPCRTIAPLLEGIAARYDGNLRVVKLNVDENPETAQAFGIISIPTLLFFKHGQIVDRLVGAVPRSQLEIRIIPTSRD
jgi:thioredoxin 1